MPGTRGVEKTRTSFPDLSGADLGGVHVAHANLGAANLSGAKTNCTTLNVLPDLHRLAAARARIAIAGVAWTTPVLVEICIGLEINGYLPPEF